MADTVAQSRSRKNVGWEVRLKCDARESDRGRQIAGDKAETPVTFLGRQQTVRETNLLEQDSRAPEEQVVRLNPYQIKTLKLRVGQ